MARTIDRRAPAARGRGARAAASPPVDGLRDLIRQIPAAVVIHGADTSIVASNALAQELLGLTEAQLFGKTAVDPDWRFLRQDGSAMPVAEYPVNQVVATRAPLRNLVAGVHRPGRDDDVWVLVNAQPVLDAGGAVAQVLVSFTDVTQRLRAEEAARAAERALRDLNDALEQRVADRTAQLSAANAELEDFLYSVSHDLRAPLRHVDGYLGLLRGRAAGRLDEEGSRCMDAIAAAADRLGALIEGLLAFTRLGREEVARVPVDLAPLLAGVVAELEPATRGRAVDWRLGPLPTVRGDAELLRLVLHHLLSNALKFTRPRRPAVIEVGAAQGPGGEVTVHVRDNGVGFDSRYADKLFGVFQRLHRPDEFEGTGIGLANVRRIIRRHGGRTWATGALDQGATIYFSLPPG